MTKKPVNVFLSFYTKNLHRYLSKLPAFSLFDIEAFNLLEKFSARDCELWVHTNIEFLSGLECLAVAISLGRKNDFSQIENTKKISKYFYNCIVQNEHKKDKQDQIYLAYLGLSICHFESSLESGDISKQRKELKIAEHYLHEASLYFDAKEITDLYHTLYQAALGEVEKAIWHISRASKVTSAPRAYYEVLEFAYNKLKMKNVALFYRNRIERLVA
ncbi:hypothetical protein M899_0387 [Bacteriovorax sp. BSW11_IV]|uniref:hypothetical protein n=1 Tax=Bacteriovorax sp. BSW11_IV TaxID=1353529 RepID=UPI00038A52AE|nr:hypothetical protein [Bacteriovorax sp. BSW11_IV]EQC43061.1 hypothetical protein M899_0387 [Bacteriovorax sp. BSW11_IV]